MVSLFTLLTYVCHSYIISKFLTIIFMFNCCYVMLMLCFVLCLYSTKSVFITKAMYLSPLLYLLIIDFVHVESTQKVSSYKIKLEVHKILCYQEVYILRTTTGSAAMGMISARDFVDLIINVNNDIMVGTMGKQLQCTVGRNPLQLLLLLFCFSFSLNASTFQLSYSAEWSVHQLDILLCKRTTAKDAAGLLVTLLVFLLISLFFKLVSIFFVIFYRNLL